MHELLSVNIITPVSEETLTPTVNSRPQTWTEDFFKAVKAHNILQVKGDYLELDAENNLVDTLQVLTQELVVSEQFYQVIVVNPILQCYTIFTKKSQDSGCFDHTYFDKNTYTTIHHIKCVKGLSYKDSLINILRIIADKSHSSVVIFDCRDFIKDHSEPVRADYELMSGSEKLIIEYLHQLMRVELENTFKTNPQRKSHIILGDKNFTNLKFLYPMPITEFELPAWRDEDFERMVELLPCSPEIKDKLLKPSDRYLLTQQYPHLSPVRKYEYSSIKDLLNAMNVY